MSTQTIEKTTLSNLVFNEPYTRKVLPFLKPEYFSNPEERIVFEWITKFVEKYNNNPTKEALSIEVDGRKDINDEQVKKVTQIIETLSDAEVDMNWLVETTEKFCKDKAVYNAILNGIQIISAINKSSGVLLIIFKDLNFFKSLTLVFSPNPGMESNDEFSACLLLLFL